MTSGFHRDNFNTLPSLIEARTKLDHEFRVGGLDFEKNFLLSDDIRHLFLEGDEACQFGIFIAHRHALLEEGECMVSTMVRRDLPLHEPQYGFHSLMQPRLTKGSENSSHIVPCSWMFADGKFLECEYREIEDDFSDHYLPPSSEFFRNFREICNRFGITVLGIFSLRLTRSEVNFDSVLLREEYTLEPRSRTARLIKRLAIEEDMIPSAWIPGLAKDSGVWLVGTVEDVTVLDFNYESYNRLPSPFRAHRELRTQVQRLKIPRFVDLFRECADLRMLFLEGPEAGRYGIILAHRHHSLQSGERMVMTVEPPEHRAEFATVSTPRSSSQEPEHANDRTVATSWILVNDKFEEFEHKVLREDTRDDQSRFLPPSPRFFREFKRLCRRYQITVLGIFSRELPFGRRGPDDIQGHNLTHFILETTVNDSREQMTRQFLRKDVTTEAVTQAIKSAWILFRTSNVPAIRNAVDEISKKETQEITRAKKTLDERKTANLEGRLEHDQMKLDDLEFFQGSDIFLYTDIRVVATDGLSCQHNCSPNHFD